MKLKIKNDKVNFLMTAGKDVVKSEMSALNAREMIKKGTVTESDKYKDFPICVNDKFFFEGSIDKK